METNKAAIEAAATNTATPAATPMAAAPAAATQTPAPEATPAPASSEKFEEGGKVSGDKIQWVAIGIFAITITALVYKAMYYRKAITLLGNDNAKTNKKLQELEKNLRAVRGDKYEGLA